MIIEFVGLPGSGKTTINREISIKLSLHKSIVSPHTLRGRYLRERHGSVWTKLAIHLNTLRMYPRFLLSGAYHIWQGFRPPSDKLAATKQFAATLDTYVYLHNQKSPREWVVFEEGIAQRAFMVMVDVRNEISRRAIQQYALAMPKPDVLIYLKVPPHIAAKRIQLRPTGITSRLQGLSVEELTLVLEKAQVMFDTLIESLRRTSSLIIFELDTVNLSQAPTELECWLNAYLLEMNSVPNVPDKVTVE